MSGEVVSGIYRIDGPNGKFYIGSAKHLPSRLRQHKSDLNCNRHANAKLQAAWNKYGGDSFRFSVIERVERPEDLINREQHWLDVLGAVENGYNILPTAGNNLGFTHSEETRRKMSEARTGLSYGPVPQERRDRISAALKGRPQSPESARKSAASRRGRKLSDETKEKIRQRHLGRKNSLEHREKVAEANRGKKHSEETKAKMRESHRRRRESQTNLHPPTGGF